MDAALTSHLSAVLMSPPGHVHTGAATHRRVPRVLFGGDSLHSAMGSGGTSDISCRRLWPPLLLHPHCLALWVPWERGQWWRLQWVRGDSEGSRAVGTVWDETAQSRGRWWHWHAASPGAVTSPARAASPSLCRPAGLLRFEVPSLHVPPDVTLCRDPPEAPQRLSGPGPATRREEEEESESTAL